MTYPIQNMTKTDALPPAAPLAMPCQVLVAPQSPLRHTINEWLHTMVRRMQRRAPGARS
ncbi:hypothetical protein BVG79_00248 [Ketogulonicigenium robustum]|uniref:Uncharacterized protein n=1 Tax=Ketogulonicigenium robustum TaxID=92947 RepID=A0A1W6NWG9_9RHOB|nr:hypothetical protein BVG79_00248 [Ketogulonicigenium robustum]